ncbi:hypothetical protein [Marinobacter sp. ATCH36]|uniref:hypothetical protein n=1 Tax=Marinobacter sp. ATCH36 TaxID=2945106 RepID=UPI002020A403|nr:hypothetical protein [Marinobacter sp. ATCH36]MCL7944674.1 hypothetical protein [Marinobacter sp. ATCH36]
MINTGLMFRLPLESDYSAMRRFVIANRTRNLQELRGELAALVPGKRRGQKATLAERAQAWEYEYCKTYGIDYVAPNTAPVNRELRNCPECARIGYHSALYQYPWVQRCPIHDCDVVTVCPICRTPWPPLTNLLTSDCPCCSARGFQRGAVEKTDLAKRINDKFMPIWRLIGRYEKASGLSLRAQDATFNEYYTHRSITPLSPNWPSLITHNSPDKQRLFERFGVCLARVQEKTFQLDPGGDVVGVNWEHLYELQQLVQQQEHPRLRTQLARRFGPDHKDRATRLMFSQPVTLADVVHLSWINWHQFVTEGRYPTRHLSYIDGCTFFHGPHNDRLRPGAPCFMTHVTKDSASRYLPLSPHYEGHYKVVPESLQVWLYTCDLWWTFIAMLYFFDSAALAMNRGWRWSEFIENLKEEGNPDTWHSPRYLFFERSPGELGVRILDRVANFSFDEVDLTIAH